MPAADPPSLLPRKLPVQARSAASVDAILVATVQVLAAVGKERLTTARVARRAGVSVGTLYQYFPNKVALLRAALRRHLLRVRDAVTEVFRSGAAVSSTELCVRYARAFLRAKLQEPSLSVALYAVSSDVDGMGVAKEIADEIQEELVALLRSMPDPVPDPALTATVLQGMIAGVSRRLVETPQSQDAIAAIEGELEAAVRGYLGQIQRRP